MTSTSPKPEARRIVTTLVLVAAASVLLLMARIALAPDVDPKVQLANETTRVDYEDGVSCYHRRGGISCVFVPSRAPMGPVAPAVLVEDIVEPTTDIIPNRKRKK
jgi:hypothetical protein